MITKHWWKESVVYQIYPRSFKDSDGDGIGDLRGIEEKLDYLASLGVDVLWLCPIYASPNCDNGYDIADYRGIMAEFGTMEDFDLLLASAHQRGLKIVLDLVVNHTSDEHAWFRKSRESSDGPFRDFYIWRKGVAGGPPNSWRSAFGGSAWTYDERTGSYYLHCFAEKQPDLNWDNPAVREQVQSLVRFWLDKGIDGFRMDVINMISKHSIPSDEEMRAAGKDPTDLSPYVMNGPNVHLYLRELNEKVLSHYDIMTVGETPLVSPATALAYVAEDRQELNMVFNFEHMDLDRDQNDHQLKPLKLSELKRVFSSWQEGLGHRGWNSLYWDNHDQPRVVSRFGDDRRYRVESAKMLATCLHFLRGTPYIYQGEEIGMTNVAFSSIEDYRDIGALNGYKEEVLERGRSAEEFMAYLHKMSRDNARTPMQWTDGVNADFTVGTPWIKVNPRYTAINVASQLENPDSIFNYYRRLIELRKKHEIIVYGDYRVLLEDSEDVYAYQRSLGSERLLVLCNFSGKSVFCKPDTADLPTRLHWLIGNYPEVAWNPEVVDLHPYECRVYLGSLGK